MKINNWTKAAIVVVCGVLALTGCSRHKKPNPYAVDEANAAYGAQASGLGSDADFGDETRSGGSLLSKRTYYFDFDSNVVHNDDKPAILANANYLANHGSARVTLEGHTDPRGSREYNIGLGERRAKAVASMLTSHGVQSEQIRVVSYGAEKLACQGRTEADYQRDRRVVLVYRKR